MVRKAQGQAQGQAPASSSLSLLSSDENENRLNSNNSNNGTTNNGTANTSNSRSNKSKATRRNSNSNNIHMNNSNNSTNNNSTNNNHRKTAKKFIRSSNKSSPTLTFTSSSGLRFKSPLTPTLTSTQDLGSYTRPNVTNIQPGTDAFTHFHHGLRLLLSYQHEEAARYFLRCLETAPDCALAHALVALCHSPNYNFKGEAYYYSSFPPNLDGDGEEEEEDGEIEEDGEDGEIEEDEDRWGMTMACSESIGDSAGAGECECSSSDGDNHGDNHGDNRGDDHENRENRKCKGIQDIRITDDSTHDSTHDSTANTNDSNLPKSHHLDNDNDHIDTEIKSGSSDDTEDVDVDVYADLDYFSSSASPASPNLNLSPRGKHCYPSQILAEYHSRMAVEKVAELRSLHSRKKVNRTRTGSETESQSQSEFEFESADNTYNTCSNEETKDNDNDNDRYLHQQQAQQAQQTESAATCTQSSSTSSSTTSKTRITRTDQEQTAQNDQNTSNNKNKKVLLLDTDHPREIQQVEILLINAIRCLNSNPGIDPSIAENCNGVAYKNAMRTVYRSYPHDAEVAYFFAESIMVLHAWKLFDYPTGRPLSSDVAEVKEVLEVGLREHGHHVGLCHMYVHLCEMATYPEKALVACDELRTRFPEAGHLLHMPTHIDVLLGDYDACVKWNDAALVADKKTMQRSPETSNVASFYFGYISHNYHMLIYGAILGAMEQKAMEVATELNTFLHEGLFVEKPELAVYLESYGTMDVHVMVRFGRWGDILNLALPRDSHLMLYRAACIHYAKAIAYANLGDIAAAKTEAEHFEQLRLVPDAKNRILHNNCIADLLDIDSFMIRGEIAFFEQSYEVAFECLRAAVKLQDGLNYDEPWGKMQPVRHALGGLLLKRGQVEEAEQVYREDLRRLPNNPWSIRGLMSCLDERLKGADWATGTDMNMNMDATTTTMTVDRSPCCCSESIAPPKLEQKLSLNQIHMIKEELKELEQQFIKQRQSEWADYNVTHSCACCISEESKVCLFD